VYHAASNFSFFGSLLLKLGALFSPPLVAP
jgi:hypothetical protein